MTKNLEESPNEKLLGTYLTWSIMVATPVGIASLMSLLFMYALSDLISPKIHNFYLILAGLGTLVLLSSFVYIKSYKKARVSLASSTDRVVNLLKSKYGVFLRESPISVMSYYMEVRRENLSATNRYGDRIQVTLELINDGADIIAFSSGAEMPKLNDSSLVDVK